MKSANKYKSEEPGQIFVQPWWLDVVTEGNWDEIKIEKGGSLFARLPFFKKKEMGLQKIIMPPLTQTMGPWIKQNPDSKYYGVLSREIKMMDQIIESLPYFDSFYQKFNPNITNWLPFYWNDFEQTTRYTYQLTEISNLDTIWKQMESKVRRDINKAEEVLVVKNDLPIDDFWELHKMVFQRQNMNLPYSKELFIALDEACKKNNCSKVFYAIDGKKRIHSTLYLVWDENTAFYLSSGSDPELRNSGALSLLLWEAIKYSSTLVDTFDFEGSMDESIERFVRSFGSVQKPYFSIKKYGRKVQGIEGVKNLGKAILGR